MYYVNLIEETKGQESVRTDFCLFFFASRLWDL